MPKETINHANTTCAFWRPGRKVDCLVGCRTNDKSLAVWGWDIKERSLPHVRQCRPHGGFLWPETQIRESNEQPHNQQKRTSLCESLPQFLHFLLFSSR